MTDSETVLVMCPACKGPLVDAGGFKHCDPCNATFGKEGEIVADTTDLDSAARLALHFWIEQPPNPGEVPSKEWLLGLVKVINVWTPVATQLPPPHETVLARDEKGDIYQARVCYGMHSPWWCGHSGLNFGVILQDNGIEIKEWRHLL